MDGQLPGLPDPESANGKAISNFQAWLVDVGSTAAATTSAACGNHLK